MSLVLENSLQEKSFEDMTAQEVLAWSMNAYSSKVALASSFGAEDVVLIDMMVKLNPQARIFTLDTGRLHQETYDVMDAIRGKYGISLEIFFPRTDATEEMVRANGLNLFYESIEKRKLCCGIRKVEPLNRALSQLDAWITGLRREQAVTRTRVEKVEPDSSHSGLVKINPIADWTEAEVWDYVKTNGVPYNKLHDQGFPSIGCAPCTRAVAPGEDTRAGRWWWENPETKECGLHVKQPSSR
ncbi:MAG: phosphoadenylyl-sulfate reductase [Armatimonadetes bacterium]|nr:phosphoadenylyl-sulfate reductase [Armatimonadota bacterium]